MIDLDTTVKELLKNEADFRQYLTQHSDRLFVPGDCVQCPISNWLRHRLDRSVRTYEERVVIAGVEMKAEDWMGFFIRLFDHRFKGRQAKGSDAMGCLEGGV